MDILSFRGDYRFLSNFYPASVTYDGTTYPTVEHAYQAAKFPHQPILQTMICRSLLPGSAKRIGADNAAHVRPDWHEVRLQVMQELLEQKFATNPLRAMLMRTYPFHLQEGNQWGDRFWGVYKNRGENHLGRLLMKIRDAHFNHRG